MSKPTLTGGNRRVPCVVAQWRTAACCCGVAYETVTTVTSPAHHAVNVTTTLRGDGAVERRVRGRAVQSCQRANKMSIYAKFNKVASLPNRQKYTFTYKLMTKTSLNLFINPEGLGNVFLAIPDSCLIKINFPHSQWIEQSLERSRCQALQSRRCPQSPLWLNRTATF